MTRNYTKKHFFKISPRMTLYILIRGDTSKIPNSGPNLFKNQYGSFIHVGNEAASVFFSTSYRMRRGRFTCLWEQLRKYLRCRNQGSHIDALKLSARLPLPC